MVQPELGRLIAELRRSKGWTQEELVGKCNLNVRTLQRIESGAVTPRSYTVRAIFTALEYLPGGSSGDNFYKKAKGISLKRIKGCFNLKTHTIAKVVLLSIIVLSAGITWVVFTSKCDVQEKYVKDNSMGVVVLRPRIDGHFAQYYLGDTLCLAAGEDLIQQHGSSMFLNRQYVGEAQRGDTVIYNKATLFKKSSLTFMPWAYQDIPGYSGMIFKFPRFPLKMFHNETGMHYCIDKDDIVEIGSRIFLNGEYIGDAYPGDTVVFRNRSLMIEPAQERGIKNN